MWTPLAILIAILGSNMALAAQPPKAFDVASVKQVVVRPGVGFSCGFRWEDDDGGRALAGRFRTLMPVRCLIAVAYEVPVLHIVGGPDWVDLDLFDVDGRSDGPATRADTTAMLRTVLADRFGLVVQQQPSFTTETWVLKRARNDGRLGPGIRQARLECITRPQNATIDRTGLTGLVDYYARIPPAAVTSRLTEDDRLSIFDAVQEALGLTLEREEIMRPAVIIERVSRPAPN